jgi:hypothetical protein
MPGYRTLSSQLGGSVAEHAREAELHQRGGDTATAARLLEDALEASLRIHPEMPGWLCGRLASVYRSLKRYDDEVMLLERYRETQRSEEARTRFDARLSKARAIAERKRRPQTGAIDTVRQVRRRSSQRRRSSRHAADSIPPASSDAPSDAPSPAPGPAPGDAELAAALADVSPTSAPRTRAVLARMCAEARSAGVHMEELVAALKRAWIDAPRPVALSDTEWHERYSSTLIELLALHFGDAR